MRFKVPQNIDMQDRVLGPLTMFQFIYAVIGFGVCYIIYMSGLPKPIAYALIIPIALFVVCLDFVKVNERPFLEFVKATIAYIGSPKQRIWHQGDANDLQVEIYKVQKDTGPAVHYKGITKEDISELAKKIDTGEKLIKN